MGLFNREKKTCGICGKELGMLGKRKLEDGYLCKDCISKLSPFFSERRHSTVDEIAQQLEYREANKGRVAQFRPTRTLGNYTKVMLDEDNGVFIVTRSKRWQDENPDVIDFSQVTGARVDVDENREEIMRELPDGKKESYYPPRYEIHYDVNVLINVDSPYFDEIKIDVDNGTVGEFGGSGAYDNARQTAPDICDALTAVRQEVRASKAPKTAVTCPHCRATTIPDASGRCEYCGGAIAG